MYHHFFTTLCQCLIQNFHLFILKPLLLQCWIVFVLQLSLLALILPVVTNSVSLVMVLTQYQWSKKLATRRSQESEPKLQLSTIVLLHQNPNLNALLWLFKGCEKKCELSEFAVSVRLPFFNLLRVLDLEKANKRIC